MEDYTRLLSLCACMLVGCYVAGMIPLAFSLSEVGNILGLEEDNQKINHLVVYC